MSDTPSTTNLEEEKFMRRARGFADHFFKTASIPTFRSLSSTRATGDLSRETLRALLVDQLDLVFALRGSRDVVRDFEIMVNDAINGFRGRLLTDHQLNASYPEARELNMLCDNMRTMLADRLRLEQRERLQVEAVEKERRTVSHPQNETGGKVVKVDFKERKRQR